MFFNCDTKETKNLPKNLYEDYEAFTSAVNWNQNWIKAIIAFHVLNYVLFIATRNNISVQVTSFFFLMTLMVFLEYINSYCFKHWSSFSDQNYFDKNGLFIGITVATPVIILCTIQLVRVLQTLIILYIFIKFLLFQINFLVIASSLLIKAKRMELARKNNKPKEN